MDTPSILLGIGLPLLIGAGMALAASDASEIEFWVARAFFVLAALDAAAFAVWSLWSAEKLTAVNVTATALVGATVLVVLVVGLRWVDYREDKTIAYLRPGNGPSPSFAGRRAVPPPNSLIVSFGSNLAWGTNLPFAVLQMGEMQMLAVDRTPGSSRLNISILRVFDGNGNLLARIEGEDLWFSPNVRHRKPNRSTLLVYDQTDRQVLKVEFVNPHFLYVEGIFHSQTGRAVSITPECLLIQGGGCLAGNNFGNLRTAIRVD